MNPTIIFEDDVLLVINKPAGITVNNSETTVHGETVQDWVEEYLKIRSTKSEIRNKSKTENSNDPNSLEFRNSDFEFASRAGIVHRIDKETSGILLVAKTEQSFSDLQRQFKERGVDKRYIALAHGKVAPKTSEIKVPVGRLPWNRTQFGIVAGGRDAVTQYEVSKYFVRRETNEHMSYLVLYPHTGRTHQIRVHLKYIGHPIFADFLYAGRKTARDDRKILARVFLHAWKIAFLHPVTTKRIEFQASLPEELVAVLRDHFIEVL